MFKRYEKDRKIEFRVVVSELDGSSKASGTKGEFICTPSLAPPPIVVCTQSQVGSNQKNNTSTPLDYQNIAAAIATVFLGAEHRECMRHLMENFKKRFRGEVFDKHMWPAAKAYITEECESHLKAIRDKSPEAIAYLEKDHNHHWCRSKFSEESKCDYINNNISESFNNWIRNLKDLHLIEVLDRIRRRIMVLFDKRRKARSRMDGVIIPSILNGLHRKSRKIGQISICRGGDACAEVSGIDPSTGKGWRYAVELDKKECTCRQWQLCGLPCIHAVAFICSIRGAHMENYVHEYYSIEKYKAAYAGVIGPMADKSQWVTIDPGFTIWPPNMKRLPDRPRKQRIVGCLEKRTKKQ